MVALDHRDIAAAWRRAHTALDAVSRPLKRLLRRAAATALPRSLLASKPPDEPEGGGVFFFFFVIPGVVWERKSIFGKIAPLPSCRGNPPPNCYIPPHP